MFLTLDRKNIKIAIQKIDDILKLPGDGNNIGNCKNMEQISKKNLEKKKKIGTIRARKKIRLSKCQPKKFKENT